MLVLVLSVNKVLACIGVLGLVLPLVGSSPLVEGSALLLDPTDSRMSVSVLHMVERKVVYVPVG